MAEVYQVIAKLLDGKSKALNFNSPSIPVISIKARIHQLTSIPVHQQLLLSNGKHLGDDETLEPSYGYPRFPTVHLLLRLRGGKGGFGSLLRGAATKAGQKKTNNFDACRDMSGRRLRHINAERKLEEWMAEEKERKLEKMAEEFIKKREKTGKKGSGGGGDGGAEKYVDKYRKDSAKCMEEVEKSVRESLREGFASKRKVGGVGGANDSQTKKLKIWMGKRKLDDSDGDATDQDDDSDDGMVEKNVKSVVIDGENCSDSSKEEDRSSGSITSVKLNGESSVGCPSESGPDEEKETNCRSPDTENNILSEHALEICEKSPLPIDHLDSVAVSGKESVRAEIEKSTALQSGNVEEAVCEQPNVVNAFDVGVTDNSNFEPVIEEAAVAANSDDPGLEKPLNFDDYSSAEMMEVLGMEMLKTELQARGLKCGGTLQERAARLFLLKTTPLEKLPTKLLAKK